MSCLGSGMSPLSLEPPALHPRRWRMSCSLPVNPSVSAKRFLDVVSRGKVI